jgi:IclR family KDG regulon transcriptional repressor
MMNSSQRPADDMTLGSRTIRARSGRERESNLQSLTNGLDVLYSLKSSDNLTLTQISEKLQLNKTVTYRILNTLEQSGLIVRNRESKRYSLSVLLWELGYSALRSLPIREIAAHHLRTLAFQTKESVNLSVYDHGEVLYVDSVRNEQWGLAHVPLALRCPAHCSAAGKVMLAYHTGEEIERYCSDSLVVATPNTISSPDRLRSELDQIRTRGFAVNRGEWHVESCGIAVPIFDHTGYAIAAIGVATPPSRFTDDFVNRVAEPARGHASEISRALGFRETAASWLALA